MDRRLSEAKRRFLASGVLEDEANYLQEALRAGELERWEIEAAAYLGNQAAMTLDTDHLWEPLLFASGAGTFVAHGQISADDAGDLWARTLGEYPKDVLLVGMLVGLHWILENTAIGLNRALYDFYYSIVNSFLAGEVTTVPMPGQSGPVPEPTGPMHFGELTAAIGAWARRPSDEEIIDFARYAFNHQMEYIDPVLSPKGRMEYAQHIANNLIQYVLGYKTASELLIRESTR